MIWSFDDGYIGTTTRDNRILKLRLIQRPKGLTNADWYKLAGDVVLRLNMSASQ